MNKTFITEYEKKCCQAVKELFQFYFEQSNNVYISDCGKYGFCFFEEFSSNGFETVDYYQNAKELFAGILDSYKNDYIYKKYKTNYPNRSFPDNIEDALSLREKAELEDVCKNLSNKIEKKWKEIKHAFLWEILHAAQDILEDNPNADILYSSKHGYYYASVRLHNGYHEVSSYAPINSVKDMLKYIEEIWTWNDYRQYNLNHYVPDIHEILEDLKESLPGEVWEKESMRREAAMTPFREMAKFFWKPLN